MTEDEQQSTSVPDLAHGQLCYLQIPATDITASARFYEQAFGWRVAPPQPGFEAPAMIGQWITDRPPSPEAGPVLWIHVGDVRHTLKDAERAGATPREGPIVDGSRLLASVTDPAGNLVGIVQHGEHADAPLPIRISNRTMPPCTVIPELVYPDVAEAVEWLCETFGFVERWRAGTHRAQLAFGDGAVVVTEQRTSQGWSDEPDATEFRPPLPGELSHSVMVRVADADAHHERARRRGARILHPPTDYPYGERQYEVEDLAGHRWSFSQSIADAAPEEWGGQSKSSSAGGS